MLGVLENHPNQSDSKAHGVSPELGVSLGQTTGKKQNKQQGGTAHQRGSHQGMGAGTLGGYFLFIISSLTHCTEQDSATLHFLSLHARSEEGK